MHQPKAVDITGQLQYANPACPETPTAAIVAIAVNRTARRSLVLAAWYERQGPASEVLRVGEMTASAPGRGEVRVRVHLSGVNPGDTKERSDWVGYGMPYPRIVPHSDGSGVLDAVGEDVDSSRVGRRVWVYGALTR